MLWGRERENGRYKRKFKWFIVSSNFRINIEVIFVCHSSSEEQAFICGFKQAPWVGWLKLNSHMRFAQTPSFTWGTWGPVFPPQFYYYHMSPTEPIALNTMVATQISKASVSVLFSLLSILMNISIKTNS